MYDARHQSIQSQHNISLLSVWLKFSSPITCSIKLKILKKGALLSKEPSAMITRLKRVF
jgi:hypothetical protein